MEALPALPGLLINLPAAMRAGSKAKDLLIAVLTNSTICELHLDPGALSTSQTAQMQQKLGKNRELRQAQRAHTELGAEAPRTPTSARSGVPLSKRVLSWGRGGAGSSSASGEVPVLGVLFSSPLVVQDPISGQVLPAEMLDLDRERDLICDSMREAKRNLRVRFEFATTDRLRTLVTLGQCCGLHYSGHGDQNLLMMEDGRGQGHLVMVPALKKLLKAGGDASAGLASLKFVVVSACFSEAAAQAFVEAGVPHVIAVRLSQRLSDVAAAAFTKAFYLALAVGRSIRVAYEIGKEAVMNSPNMQSAQAESDKFLLLGRGNHDSIPFPALATVDAWHPPPNPAARHQQTLPAVAECFVGRNVETYKVVTGVLDRRLVSVTGLPGVGKSAVAIRALNYLAQRGYFSDGVIYVDCSMASSTEQLGALLGQQIAIARPPQPDTSPTAATPAASPAAAAIPPTTPSPANPPSSDQRTPGQSHKSPTPRDAVAVLQSLHCLLVIDGVPRAVAQSAPFADFLAGLLSFPRVRTLLTAVEHIGHSLGEKVVNIEALSPPETARLLVKLSPKPLKLGDLNPPARNTGDFLQRLAVHPLVVGFEGNPGRVKATAPQLARVGLDAVRIVPPSTPQQSARPRECSRSRGDSTSIQPTAFSIPTAASPPTALSPPLAASPTAAPVRRSTSSGASVPIRQATSAPSLQAFGHG
uniref:AAA+ ATPase domain-containing protein n=1 Tax=Haptolina brevifila TaxID=156173 RepID=A0A7S2DM31_9EUKA